MRQKQFLTLGLCIGSLFISTCAFADSPSLTLLTSKTQGGEVTWNLSIKILAAMALLTLLPALIMTTTAFTRIIIVFSILRQAIGIPNVPGNQILIGLALMMTLYVMAPVAARINDAGITPWMNGQITETEAFEKIGGELRGFMLKQTRKADLGLFARLSKTPVKNGEYPLSIIMPAFLTSELKTAFQIGFLIFLPFLIIDLVTASVLMSMGMMMLSPMVISLPFKLLFFVLVDGWTLMLSSLVTSFR
ncbi:flagellar biosynthesis protein FliP [Legionella geestiana]|uniref:Flagellar biosynthetic protein FliP n=1 Tax=Legionella geestiana TaxID=45065 RepID=A0A0W0TXS8_9GAMM|nr:flagellar type III secretion system pore protein FliP [Legionella geestiana]KTD00121.1 flagellar biosynthesis protein FliP [Legionella geestiana]QBS11833.1 flagellar type III secretion system pore protein FliP [Legionella geestiana]QDQ40552.1 flagellar type III secretion system pore protein FliP [Legionella geestiana]STX53472.1 flagellar biosynthetic protein FliP [Legionella geestiana]